METGRDENYEETTSGFDDFEMETSVQETSEGNEEKGEAGREGSEKSETTTGNLNESFSVEGESGESETDPLASTEAYTAVQVVTAFEDLSTLLNDLSLSSLLLLVILFVLGILAIGGYSYE